MRKRGWGAGTSRCSQTLTARFSVSRCTRIFPIAQIRGTSSSVVVHA
ncbi:hypothetical protein EV648_102154 [Kribbella sp. VKM Ac-2568]|nr:hypothetical protein EV648_102154 [Kribbella sp. VKM Ac-2568]